VKDSRLVQLYKKLEEKGLGALLITNPHNVFYLINRWVEGWILLAPSGKFFITSPLFGEEVKKEVDDWQIIIWKNHIEKTLDKLLRNLGIKKLGFEASSLSYAEYQKLSELKVSQLVPCEGLVEELRVIKDEDELSSIRRAVQITNLAFAHLENLLKVGITEKEVSIEAAHFFRKKADKEAFPSIVLFGERTSLPHGKPTQRRLREGELVLLDIGAQVEGYCADLTRTIFFGEVDRRWQEIRSMLIQAQEEALREIKPGVKSSQIDKLVRDRVKKSGYLNAFIHNTGHGVGLEVHENPVIAPKSREVLKEGMVFTIEPGVYLAGEGGVRVERMAMVTPEGGRILE